MYELAPLAFHVAPFPKQIVLAEADNVNIGLDPTFTVIVCVPIQPVPLSLITVYVVVTVGLSTALAVVAETGDHV